MKELNKLFSDIEFQYQDESMKHRRLKICKYSFEISKVDILSLSTGLAFISIFAILSTIFIPIIDSIKHNTDVDSRLLDTFYTKVNKGNGLKIVENKGDGLKLTSTKGNGCYMTIKKSQRGSGLKILK